MKRSILIFTAVAAAIVVSTGCSSVALTASGVANRVELGMSVEEFKRMARPMDGTVELDAMTPEGTVYRIDEWAGEGTARRIIRARFYVFDTKGRLTEVATRDFARPYSRMR